MNLNFDEEEYAYKVHTKFLGDDESSSEDKSDFDEFYKKNKPPPVAIEDFDIIKIDSFITVSSNSKIKRKLYKNVSKNNTCTKQKTHVNNAFKNEFHKNGDSTKSDKRKKKKEPSDLTLKPQSTNQSVKTLQPLPIVNPSHRGVLSYSQTLQLPKPSTLQVDVQSTVQKQIKKTKRKRKSKKRVLEDEKKASPNISIKNLSTSSESQNSELTNLLNWRRNTIKNNFLSEGNLKINKISTEGDDYVKNKRKILSKNLSENCNVPICKSTLQLSENDSEKENYTNIEPKIYIETSNPNPEKLSKGLYSHGEITSEAVKFFRKPVERVERDHSVLDINLTNNTESNLRREEFNRSVDCTPNEEKCDIGLKLIKPTNYLSSNLNIHNNKFLNELLIQSNSEKLKLKEPVNSSTNEFIVENRSNSCDGITIFCVDEIHFNYDYLSTFYKTVMVYVLVKVILSNLFLFVVLLLLFSELLLFTH